MIPLSWTRYFRNGLFITFLVSFTLNFPQLMFLLFRAQDPGEIHAGKGDMFTSYPEYFLNFSLYLVLGFLLFISHSYLLWKNLRPGLRHGIIWIFAILMVNLFFRFHVWIMDFPKDKIHWMAGYIMGQSTLVAVISVMSANVMFLNDRQRQHRLEIERLAAENIRSQYLVLKSQVDPHFLFNSLNTLNTLIPIDAPGAQKYLNEMSNLMRHSLTRKDSVTLEEELEVARSYANLMNIRYGEALSFEFAIDSKKLGLRIVPFSLQILLENVVKHNTITKALPMVVKIATEGDFLAVSNPVQPKKQPAEGEGIGLTNLSERYRLSGGQAVEISSGNGIFTVKLPLGDLKNT